MSQARCPDCDELVEITPGEIQRVGFSARWWKLILHPIKGQSKLCPGGGKQV